MRSRRRAGLALGLALSSILLAACDPGDGKTPRVEELRFDGQAPDSELVLLFTVVFSDPDGDLGEGFLETFINGRPSGLGQLDLKPLFLFNELPLDATEGELAFSLELALNGEPEPNTQFDLAMRAIDAAGNPSESESVRLEVDPR